VQATRANVDSGVSASALETEYFSSGSASSDRRISSQDGGPDLRCRRPQTRIAANSKTSGPTAPARTRSAVHAEAGSSWAIWAAVRAASRLGAVGFRPCPE
jgi:hypothetical protein